LLPDDPAEVDYTIPDVPEGLESLVADLRDEIEEGADALAIFLTSTNSLLTSSVKKSVTNLKWLLAKQINRKMLIF
jgi:hypothetical protein